MTPEVPEYDPSPEQDEGPEASEREVSRMKLIIGILVMLIPAAVPIYFALGQDWTTALILVAAAVAVGLMNTMLVYGVWSWLNSVAENKQQ